MTLLQTIEARLLRTEILGIGFSDSHEVSAICVRVKNNQLTITSRVKGAQEVSDLLTQNPGLPVALCVDTSDVLFMTSEEPITEANVSAMFADFVPGGNPTQFLMEYDPRCLTLARVAALEAVQRELGLADQVVNLCLMPVAARYLVQYLRSGEEVVHLHRFRYEFTGDQYRVERADLNPDTLVIEGEQVSPDQVLPLVAILNYLNSPTKKAGDGLWRTNYSDFLFRKLYTVARMPVLAVFLLVFLINSFLFIRWDQNLQLAKEQAATSSQLVEQIRKTDEFLSTHEAISRELRGRLYFSIISDQLGALNTRPITLTAISIHPLSRSLKTRNTFEKDVLVVEGQTQNPMHFIDWLDEVKKQGWVTEIISQKYVNEPMNELGKFELKIRIRNEWFEL